MAVFVYILNMNTAQQRGEQEQFSSGLRCRTQKSV